MREVTNSITLTQIQGYNWRVAVTFVDGIPNAQATEVYVVTDDKYTACPEGQKSLLVVLNDQEQAVLDSLVLRALAQATTREEVDAAPELVDSISNIDQAANVINADASVNTEAVKMSAKPGIRI